MYHKLILSDKEVKLVQAALAAVSPSGGGSAPFALLHRVTEVSGLETNEKLVTTLMNTIVEEAIQVGVVARVH